MKKERLWKMCGAATLCGILALHNLWNYYVVTELPVFTRETEQEMLIGLNSVSEDSFNSVREDSWKRYYDLEYHPECPLEIIMDKTKGGIYLKLGMVKVASPLLKIGTRAIIYSAKPGREIGYYMKERKERKGISRLLSDP